MYKTYFPDTVQVRSISPILVVLWSSGPKEPALTTQQSCKKIIIFTSRIHKILQYIIRKIPSNACGPRHLKHRKILQLPVRKQMADSDWTKRYDLIILYSW
ncbi:BA75_02182T0 [Komagataella pastoris]|uniref:BA75_02182T0 n=1 Tax=Komagataella pastoris TaxID=4922 RepID=A0A1B2JB70_PICPA|nr:BA75_02182T0 [Komagataella pastoris]